MFPWYRKARRSCFYSHPSVPAGIRKNHKQVVRCFKFYYFIKFTIKKVYFIELKLLKNKLSHTKFSLYSEQSITLHFAVCADSRHSTCLHWLSSFLSFVLPECDPEIRVRHVRGRLNSQNVCGGQRREEDAREQQMQKFTLIVRIFSQRLHESIWR